MFELTIKDKVYQFRFGLGFVRAIDKKEQVKGEDGNMHDAGLQYAVAALIDEDPVKLVDILELANKTENPRVTRDLLDSYIEDDSTDLEALFKELLDFFENANATKKKTRYVKELVENEKAKAEAEQNEQK